MFDDKYYGYCSHCWIEEYSIEAISTCPDAEKSNSISLGGIINITNEGDIIIGASADIHAIFGGHASLGFNVTGFIKNIFD